jgi:sulfite oxidase
MSLFLRRSAFLAGSTAASLAAVARTVGASPVLDVINERPYDWGTPLDELSGKQNTPNRVFFIRSHMGPPNTVDSRAFTLSIDGLVNKPLHLTMADLKKMEKVEVPAVLQCAGNSRWFYGVAYAKVSHPAGAQWKYGGVGNARWGGVRVRDVLAKAGVKTNAKFATNFGLDNPVFPSTPKFIRGIELAKLMDPDTILAYEMNGETLPYYHGFPLRLLVPGWAADHSVKWFTSMTLTDTMTDNFWTSAGYRYPNKIGPPGVGVKPAKEHPVTAINVKSIVTSPTGDTKIKTGGFVKVEGFAWSGDGAYVTRVEISTDGGHSWRDAVLGSNVGKFAWRSFTYAWMPNASGRATVLARAHDNKGAVQPRISPWNPGGYLWNAIQRIDVEVASA